MKAREVFKDCEYAKECLQRAIAEKRLEDARLFWFAAIALLRAIGHVLHKVDAMTHGNNFRIALDQRYKLWQEDPMFMGFIKLERDNILKEYKSSLSEQTSTEDHFLLLNESGDRLLLAGGGGFVIGTTTITDLILGHGIYSGSSPVDVLSKALAWWDKELSELEKIS